MICKKCGKEIKDTAKFCGYCGSVNEPTIGVQTPEISETVNYTPSWMKQEVKTTINQSEEVLYHLKERYTKLSETDNRRHIGVILENIVDSIKNIEETLHRLHEAREGIEKLIQLYQVYVDIKL